MLTQVSGFRFRVPGFGRGFINYLKKHEKSQAANREPNRGTVEL